MNYRFDMLGRWWEYMYPLLLIAAIINAGLVFFIIDQPNGILGAITDHLDQTRRGSPLFVVFLVVGPLFNIYVSIVSAKQAIEADDDFFHFTEKPDFSKLPSASARKRQIFVLSILTGFLLLPFTFWCYTASLTALWGLEAPIYAQPGVAAAIGIVFAVYFIVPKIFPSAARRLSKIEDAVTRGLDALDKD